MLETKFKEPEPAIEEIVIVPTDSAQAKSVKSVSAAPTEKAPSEMNKTQPQKKEGSAVENAISNIQMVQD